MNTANKQPAQPIKLHGFNLSGHSHRVTLFLSLLQLQYISIQVDFANKAHKQADFLAMNPFGQVPVIEDGAITLADSNAILVYLAKQYGPDHWLPQDAVGAAKIAQWLDVAAGLVAYGPAAARLITMFKYPLNAEEVIARAHSLFVVMDALLEKTPFLIGSMPTIADIANYTYIAHAPEGNVALDAYPNLRAWLQRIEALPHFVPMAKTAIGLAA